MGCAGRVVELVVNSDRNDDVLSERRGRGNGLLVFTEAFVVQLDCLVHPSFGFFSGFASGDTARQVLCLRGEVLAGVLDHDEEAMHHDSFSLMASRTFGIAFLDDAHSAGWLDKSGSPGFFGHGHSGVVLHLDHQAAVVASTRRISLSKTAEILLAFAVREKLG